MAVLNRIVATGALLATDCYEPQLRDCVVSCTGPTDCAPGQVCDSDGMCASPEVAGSCSGIVAATDAGLTDATPDARTIDAPPMNDAPLKVVLQIEVSDRGTVVVENAGSCHSSAPNHICTIGVMNGAPTLLTAEPDPEYRFEKWELGPCIGQDETCMFTPVALLTQLKVKFKRD